MGQDWVEFHRRLGGEEISVKRENIIDFTKIPFDADNNLPEHTSIQYADSSAVIRVEVSEHYNRVKQKIMDAEKTVYFTRGEYELMLDACKGLEGYETIVDKLNRVLGETN